MREISLFSSLKMLKIPCITIFLRKPKMSPLVKRLEISTRQAEKISMITLHVFQLQEIFEMASFENESKV